MFSKFFIYRPIAASVLSIVITLGGFIAFMTWLYWTSFVLLVGAELNAELAKESKKGCVPPKDAAPEDRRRIDRQAPLNRAA